MDEATTPVEVHTEKQSMREQMRGVWQHADLDAVGRSVAEQLLVLPEVLRATTVAVYAALPGEVPTDQLVAELDRRGVRVVLPVLRDDDSLGWRVRAAGAALHPGRRGTQEPDPSSPEVPLSEADVVVVPGVAYDATGRRLGRGGGSYDRALGDVDERTLVVGVAPDEVVVDTVPTEPHDRRVDVVVTPRGARRCRPDGC